MELWVRLESDRDEDAFRLHVAYSATVSDVLLQAHALFTGHGADGSTASGGPTAGSVADRLQGPPQHLALTVKGETLPNRETLRRAVSAAMKEDMFDISRLTFVVVKKTAVQRMLKVAAAKFVAAAKEGAVAGASPVSSSGAAAAARTPRSGTLLTGDAATGSTVKGVSAKRAAAALDIAVNATPQRSPRGALFSPPDEARSTRHARSSRSTTPQQPRGATAAPAKTRKLVSPATPRGRSQTPTGHSTTRRSSAGARAAPIDSSRPAPQFPRPGPTQKTRMCVFKEKWGTMLCATCGVHRRFHHYFEPSVEERQRQLLERAQGGGAASTTEHLTSGVERLSWNRRPLLELQEHESVARELLARRSPHRVLWRGEASAQKLMTPLREPCTSGRQRVHAACAAFEPLWGHNEVCSKCYRFQHEHPPPPRVLEKERRMRERRQRLREGQERKRALESMPWDTVLVFCEVRDLFVVASVSRQLARLARPVLEATMQLVLDFDRPPTCQVVEDDAVHLAECLSPYSEKHLRLGQLVQTALRLVGQKGDSDLDNFTYRIEILRQLAVLDAVTFDDAIARELREVESLGFGAGHDLFPVVSHLTALRNQYFYKRQAGEYLRRTMVQL